MSTFCSTSAVEFSPGREPCRPPSRHHDRLDHEELECQRSVGSPLLWRRIGYDRRHFHHLFCPPRTTTRRALRDPVQRDPWHGDDLLDKRRRVDLLQEFHHLVSQLRHKHIEDLHGRQDVHNVRHGVPLYSRQWPHLNKRCRPGGKHVPVVVQPVVLRACRPGGRSRRVLALFCPLGAAWWCVSARSMETVIRSCRNTERSRRSLLRLAAEVPASRATNAIVTR